ncbi:SOH1-domain-containing protein [Crucibulum laeve]|uniref:Mediator of RNA polymerase II transcription subunit 31 n=1 Tax=Crucibulum laeve TaxID=68775 RepID=A0A5C3MGV8_9AGAR|nr:SOH1-domain-containing protein [Crucibulum laeve]
MSVEAPPTPGADPKAANRARFELELEFVQSLANPFYLHSLAQQNILEQPAFINFLEYLLYFKEKDYARFIHYPHALHHLELLQHAQFRTDMKKDEFFREFLHQKQFDHWRTWREPSYINGLVPDAVGPAKAEGHDSAIGST